MLVLFEKDDYENGYGNISAALNRKILGMHVIRDFEFFEILSFRDFDPSRFYYNAKLRLLYL
jgi:hypothetical protein